MIKNEIKLQVLAALAPHREKFAGSDSKFATSIGINAAIYNRLKKGDTERVLSDGKWISLARILEINLKGETPWKTAETKVFSIITAQLTKCQNDSISAMLCDLADIGKTYTAKAYLRNNANAVYIDCSQVKSKQKLVRQIAKEFGVDHTGKYADVYEDLVYYIKGGTLEFPLIILDEAGDLNYDAFLELKALWNATEKACGWYMMGADGLKEKVRRAINCKKVGYAELFSRYGSRYQKVINDNLEGAQNDLRECAIEIIKANMPEGASLKDLLKNSQGSLRRIYTEISKLK